MEQFQVNIVTKATVHASMKIWGSFWRNKGAGDPEMIFSATLWRFKDKTRANTIGIIERRMPLKGNIILRR